MPKPSPPGKGFDILNDPAALRTLAHPTRQRIFAVAVHEAVSAKDLAGRFEQPLARISYHVRTLADAGLLHVVSRTPRRGATETHYRAVSTLEISEEMIDRAGPEFRALWAEANLRNLAADAQHAFAEEDAAEARDSFVGRGHFMVTEAGRRRLHEEVRAFYVRLGELEEELWEEVRTGGPVHELVVGVLFYPGTLRAERNRPFIMSREQNDEDLDTIPGVEAEREL